ERIARFQIRDAEAAEADDSGAQQRSGGQIGETVGNSIHEVFGCGDEFGITAVDRVAGEYGRFTEIFLAGAAVFAGSVGRMEPGNADGGAWREAAGSGPILFDHADHLMPGNHRLL